MNSQTFLESQVFELRRLLTLSQNDPVITPQLNDRLARAEKELAKSREQDGSLFLKDPPVVLPRAAIFMRGGGVADSSGIRPTLAGEALIQYERMFVEYALHDEREAARRSGRHRRRRGSAKPSLLFTGTPRGSFGLEFVPKFADDDQQSLALHAQSLRNLSETLIQVITEEGNVDDLLRRIPKLLGPLKQFLAVLASHDADLRLASHDGPSTVLNAAQVKHASDRLIREVTQETVDLRGIFRGVTFESHVFDLKLDDETTITGTLAEDLVEEDIERLTELTNHQCQVKLEKTVIAQTASLRRVYVLLSASPVE